MFIMDYQSSDRKWLITEIEAELGNTDLGLDIWPTSKLKETYNKLQN